MYQKVDTNLIFVDREKEVEQFGKNNIFEKVWTALAMGRRKPIPFMTDRQQPTASLI